MMLIVILRRYDEESKGCATRNKVRPRFFIPLCFVQNDILLGTLNLGA